MLAGAVSLLAFAWQTEQADRLVAEGQLASERARTAELTSQVGSLREDLSATEADLREAEDLAAARGQVLGQTRKVLKRVDPLLSSVDELQLLAGEIQDQRNAFGGDASLLIEELVSFANYILETDPFSYDIGYINTEIDYLNARLNDVRQASARLNSRDDDYRRASARFERRATSYSQSVRRLQRSLAEVTG